MEENTNDIVENNNQEDNNIADENQNEEEQFNNEDSEDNEEDNTDYKDLYNKLEEDHKKLEKNLEETKKYAHKNKSKLDLIQHRYKNNISKFSEDGIISPEETNIMMSSIGVDIEDTTNDIDNKVAKAIDSYKKLNKNSNIDSYVENFVSAMNYLDAKDRKDAIDYLSIDSLDDGDIIEHVRSIGGDFKNKFGDNIKKHGSLLNYVHHLEETINKLDKKNTNIHNRDVMNTSKNLNYKKQKTVKDVFKGWGM